MGTRRALAAVLLLEFLAAPLAGATMTAPPLEVTRIEVVSGGVGTLLRVHGTFPDREIIQVPYPLQIFVRDTVSGTQFVCFSVPYGVSRGDSSLVANGLDPEAALAMMEAGSTHTHGDDDGRIVQVGAGFIDVLLPPDFAPSDGEVQLYVVYQGLPLISSQLAFQIGGTP